MTRNREVNNDGRCEIRNTIMNDTTYMGKVYRTVHGKLEEESKDVCTVVCRKEKINLQSMIINFRFIVVYFSSV